MSLFLILLNTIMLALNSPWADADFKNACSLLDLIFSLFFLCETALRVVSFGMVIYKKDAWNAVDTIIVLTGVISSVAAFWSSDSFSLTALRAVRILRPVRSFRFFQAARVLILATFSSVRALGDVALMYCLFLIVFGVAGVSQYNIRIHTRCVHSQYEIDRLTDPTVNITDYVHFQAWEQEQRSINRSALLDELANYSCYTHSALDSNNRFNLSVFVPIMLPNMPLTEVLNYSRPCDPPIVRTNWSDKWRYRFVSSEPVLDWEADHWEHQACDGTNAMWLIGYKCPYNYKCMSVGNPRFGKAGFDNLPLAWLTIFTCVTQQLWYDLMYMVEDAVDPTAAGVLRACCGARNVLHYEPRCCPHYR